MTEAPSARSMQQIVWGCLRKHGYSRTVAEARAALQKAKAYQCQHCGWWHVDKG